MLNINIWSCVVSMIKLWMYLRWNGWLLNWWNFMKIILCFFCIIESWLMNFLVIFELMKFFIILVVVYWNKVSKLRIFIYLKRGRFVCRSFKNSIWRVGLLLRYILFWLNIFLIKIYCILLRLIMRSCLVIIFVYLCIIMFFINWVGFIIIW